MVTENRRRFIQQIGLAAAFSGALPPARRAEAMPQGQGKMTVQLSSGAIGVRASQTEAIALAHRFGFGSVEAQNEYLAGLSEAQLQELLADMKQKRVVWGNAGLPVEFRQDQAKFEAGMKNLPRIAAGLERAGVTRVGTWIMPCDERLTYLQNFKLHAARLGEAAKVLADHGQRLGLEYVGTQSLRNSRRYPFLHTMAETKELIAEIGTGNVGFVLDSWHWWTAGESQADILTLRNEDVVSVDLNDAPAGIAREQQIDTQRELPAATGVIDIAAFLNALTKVGYDGPVRAEPFNRALNDLENEAACAAVIESMKRAFEKAGLKS